MINQRCDDLLEFSGKGFLESGHYSQASVEGNLRKLVGWGQLALALGMSSVVTLGGNCAFAQSNIVPDNTLGVGENSMVIPNFNGLPIEAITGGAQRGQNLFHSFLEFNVAVGRGAYFLSPDATIQNILARVTGGNPSEILGTLGTIGGTEPNLFLINPNGIIFGEGSKLDVGGSFVATTANAVGLGDTGRFSASEPDSSNLLNINPDVLFHNRLSNGAEIVNRSTAIFPVLFLPLNGLPLDTGLQVAEGKSLLFLGGDVSLDGGVLRAPGGRVELGGLSAPGTVELNSDTGNPSLSFPDDVARANVSINNGAGVVAAGNGGSVAINADTVDILGGSTLVTGIAPGSGSVDTQAGDIAINATGTVTLSESSFIINAVFGTGDTGNIEITTGSLEIADGAALLTATLGEGNVGDVKITATDRVRFDGADTNGVSSGAFSFVAPGAVADGGDVEITTGSLEVTNGASMSSIILGDGNAGDVRIRATDTVRFDGVGSNGASTSVFSTVGPGGMGDGGDIEIITDSLEVTNGAALITDTFGEGNAGGVRITARDTVRFDGVGTNGALTGASSTVAAGAVGDGGDIEITTGFLEVTNGAGLSARTLGEGNAGSVKISATDRVRFDGVGSNRSSSAASSVVGATAVGNGGDIEITTSFLEVTNGAGLSASTLGEGNAGSVKITAAERVLFDGVGSNGLPSGAASGVAPGAVGNGSDIEINTSSLEMTNGAVLNTVTRGEGNAGDVKISATDRVLFDGVGSTGFSSGASSAVREGGVGNGGDIEITTSSLEVTNGAQLSASTLGEGNAGGLRITAAERVLFDGVGSNEVSSTAFSAVRAGAVGNGSDIEINTNSLEVTNGAGLSASTFGEGNAGGVRIIAADRVRFDGVGSNGFSSFALSSVEAGAVGDGRDLEITTGSLEVTNGAQLSARTSGQGNAGGVRIRAADRVLFDGIGSNGLSSRAFSSVEAGALGNGGDMEITADSIEVTNGAFLSASTRGEGNAGIMEIITDSLEVTNGAFLSTAAFDGEGNAGGVRITATDTVHFNGGNLFSALGRGVVGTGGDIEITTGSLEVTNGAVLSANTLGEGNAGNVKIRATDRVLFDGGSDRLLTGVTSQVSPGAMGDGGDIEINTGSLEITNSAALVAGTLGEGDAGNVKINATDRVLFDGVGGVFSSVFPGAIGDGGDIEITTDSLQVTNGAALVAGTLGEGNAGNLRIRATDRVLFDGGDAFSSVAPGAIGDGGEIEITAGSLSLTDASITSESEGNGRAGDITINTRHNLETNRSSISATTLSGDGGNLTLQVGDLLLLRNNSKISTSAGVAGAGGDGGDITITAEFVIGVAREDSDITANAFNGSGGNITITTQAIFGLQFRDRLTPLSDITAKSENGIDGEFILNLLFPIDVTQGLVDLPSNLVDATKLIDRRCTPNNPFRQSSFYITGRGGIPQNPTEMLDADATVSGWVTLDAEAETGNEVDTNSISTTPKQIIEAQGIVTTPDGQIYLAAEVPTVTPHGEWIPAVDCYTFRN